MLFNSDQGGDLPAHVIKHRQRGVDDQFGPTFCPSQAAHLIGEDDARYALALRNWNFERIAFGSIGDRAGHTETGALVIGPVTDDEHRPTPALLVPSGGIEVEPDDIARIRAKAVTRFRCRLAVPNRSRGVGFSR